VCVVFFLLGESPASEFYVLTFVPSSYGTDSVPKRQQIKFRRRGFTQKKEYNIQNMAEV
jgi:hypothetical protein